MLMKVMYVPMVMYLTDGSSKMSRWKSQTNLTPLAKKN